MEDENVKLSVQPVKRSVKYYVPGYQYIIATTFLRDWDYVIQEHTNQNGKHYDLRLYCPGGNTPVFSWNTKKKFWEREQPTPIRRSKDHPYRWLSYNGEYKGSAGHINKYEILDSGIAQLLDMTKKELFFRTKTSIFKLINVRGVRYAYLQIT